MFFVVRGHRLGLDYWHYQGETLELSDVEGVKARLRQLCDPWVGRVEAGGCLSAGEVLYGYIRYAIGFFNAPEYMECAVRLRGADGAVKTLAFGNCLGRVTTSRGLVGYTSVIANGEFVVGECSFKPHLTRWSGEFVDGDFEWLMHPGATLRERASGHVSVRRASNRVKLGLKFPSRWQEDSDRIVKVDIEREGQLLGHAMRSFNPVFAKGYRVGLWMRDEIPIFQSAVAINLSDGLWSGVLFAILGIWFCYAPIKGLGSCG
jgi:hypothetical protein